MIFLNCNKKRKFENMDIALKMLKEGWRFLYPKESLVMVKVTEEVTALDVSRYIVNKSIREGNPVSNLKLNKLLYLIQLESLKLSGKPLFVDEIENVRHGPIVRCVYSKYMEFIGSKIWRPEELYYEYISWSSLSEFMKSERVKFEYSEKFMDTSIIDYVMKECRHIDCWDMVEIAKIRYRREEHRIS